ncbi:MAG: hypothetical protein WCJ13_06865 [Coriobacteriia bacterium]
MNRQQTLEAIAYMALLLEPGGSFVVPIRGETRSAEDAIAEIAAAIERQARHGGDVVPNLATPDEIAMCAVAGRVLIERTPLGF